MGSVLRCRSHLLENPAPSLHQLLCLSPLPCPVFSSLLSDPLHSFLFLNEVLQYPNLLYTVGAPSHLWTRPKLSSCTSGASQPSGLHLLLSSLDPVSSSLMLWVPVSCSSPPHCVSCLLFHTAFTMLTTPIYLPLYSVIASYCSTVSLPLCPPCSPLTYHTSSAQCSA